jgi:phospholipid/cholesterol/gamma-HCH transport system ATP-binding protein
MNAPGETPLLAVEGLKKAFDGRAVLDGVDLAVRQGQILSVLGKSGTGKSVLLKCIAGILTLDAGNLRFEGRPLGSTADARVAFRSRCSYLFQHNALFDSLTALQNVALPLEQGTRLGDREILDRSREALRRLDLEGFADRYPSQMSGGMQKRLALARALVGRPEIVLFDEPTAGLDPLRRNAVFEMIARLRLEVGFTAIIVTHDLPEALAVSDTVALLDEGAICFEGDPPCFSGSTHPAVMRFRDSVDALKRDLAALRAGRPVSTALPD